jgi:hypothetical protein
MCLITLPLVMTSGVASPLSLSSMVMTISVSSAVRNVFLSGKSMMRKMERIPRAMVKAPARVRNRRMRMVVTTICQG